MSGDKIRVRKAFAELRKAGFTARMNFKRCQASAYAAIPKPPEGEAARIVFYHRQDAKVFDEFGNITCEDEFARMDNFSARLENNSGTQGYMIVYGGRHGKRNEAKARAARMKFYLVRIRDQSAERIITLDGGYRDEQTTELWLLPLHEPAPIPTPTVKAKDVQLRGRMKVRGYNCGAFIGLSQ